MLTVKQISGGAWRRWNVFEGETLVGRITMRFGDVIAYGPSVDGEQSRVLWRTVIRDENGAPIQVPPTAAEEGGYLDWGIWHVWVNLQARAPKAPHVEYELIEMEKSGG